VRRLALGALLLAGCAAGPDYERPTQPFPETHGRLARDGETVSADWWKAFADPVLDDLIARALAGNRDILAASARVDRALALLGEIEAAGLPAVGASAGFERRRASVDLATNFPAGTPRIRPVADVGVSLNYEIDLWGRARRARESSRALLEAGRESLRAAELSVATLVARSYVGLRSAETEQAAASEALAARDEALRIAREREAAGAAAPDEVARAEMARSDAHTRLALARRQRTLLLHLLGSLTAEASLEIAPAAVSLRVPPPPASGLPSQLLERRPDVREAEQLAVSANAQVGVAKGSAFPRLSLTGALGTASRELSGLFASPAATAALGGSIQYDLLDWGASRRVTEAAQAAAAEAAANYSRVALEALRETRDALADLGETLELADSAQRRAQAAAALLELARRRHEAGEISPREWADARVAHAEAVAVAAAARRDRLIAHLQVVKALGGGF
jgi:outer membrane protein, multidrug efflux system